MAAPVRATKTRAPKRGRPAGSFTQHRRIDKLRELLESEPRGLTLAEIAQSLRITPRSVHRYLRALDGTREARVTSSTSGEPSSLTPLL